MAEHPLLTLEEANARLPLIRPILERLRDLVAEAQQRQAQIEQLQQVYPSANGHRAELETQIRVATRELEEGVEEVRRLIDEAEGHGCEVKDPSTGLIDFRSLRDGEVVYLCWRLGEGDIAYWHTLQAGFKGRQPL